MSENTQWGRTLCQMWEAGGEQRTQALELSRTLGGELELVMARVQRHQEDCEEAMARSLAYADKSLHSLRNRASLEAETAWDLRQEALNDLLNVPR